MAENKKSTENQASENQQEISNNEVISQTKKKNWRSYFKEFFMLFLAVFCGFLAENYREALSNKKIEKDYIISMIQDLQADTSNLQGYIQIRKEKREMLDSLTILLTTDGHKHSGNATYYFARHIFHGDPFVQTDGTILQLKNAGNLRFIKKGNVVSALLNYEKKVKELAEWDETDARMRTTFREIGGSIFRANDFYKTMGSSLSFVRPTDNPQLVTDDLVAINNVSFQVQYLSTLTLGNFFRATAMKKEAASLIELMKEEYNLE
ncbi:MAG: hypothetical protein PSV36_14780 [Algoriphagus sp.]|nr:hypothetical protein [Algoriphagus sp.]